MTTARIISSVGVKLPQHGLAGASKKRRARMPMTSLCPTEKEFMAQVVALAKMFGWLCYHTHDSRRCEPGFPDLVLARGRQIIFVELKVKGNRATAAQKRWMDTLRGCGADYRLWRPEDWSEIEWTLKDEA